MPDIVLSLAEQHLDHVGGFAVHIILAEGKPARHAEKLVQCNRRARITCRLAPLRHIGGRMNINLAVSDRDADQRLRDAFRLRP